MHLQPTSSLSNGPEGPVLGWPICRGRCSGLEIAAQYTLSGIQRLPIREDLLLHGYPTGTSVILQPARSTNVRLRRQATEAGCVKP